MILSPRTLSPFSAACFSVARSVARPDLRRAGLLGLTLLCSVGLGRAGLCGVEALISDAHAAPAQPSAEPAGAPGPTIDNAMPGSGSDNKSPADASHGQPVHLYWKGQEIYDHNRQTVTLIGGARAVRGDTTLDGDVLIGYLRKKAPPPGQAEAPSSTASEDPLGGSLELYRIEARGHVHVYNLKDQAWGDHGIYDVDRALMLMTGQHLKVMTPQDVMTARDLMEYYPKARISVGRGNASLTTNDGKRVTADIMESFGMSDLQKAQRDAADRRQAEIARRRGLPPPKSTNSSNMDRAYGWGHVVVRTQTQTATGDRGVYLFGPELARLVGHVHVTQGQNQNNGSQALVNLRTGVSTMLPGTNSPIQGLVVPNEASSNENQNKTQGGSRK
ncbi:LptA/OstA family protein [Oecophyllibacter saccharovorans]|uniref:LptA/OstA family protein n=1 Tax=Oecophyllibacter saccharovorans TaxID=2558360 RepID=UPI001F502E87|nr:hypothetical protein [Oecophyllibacter saccharovorans]